MMVLWMSFAGNLLVVVGLIISAIVALRGMQIDRFLLGHQTAGTKESIALQGKFNQNYPEFFSKLTPFMVRTFWLGVMITVVGNILMLAAAALELWQG
jgi:uncharacterized membrane protein